MGKRASKHNRDLCDAVQKCENKKKKERNHGRKIIEIFSTSLSFDIVIIFVNFCRLGQITLMVYDAHQCDKNFMGSDEI